MDPVTHTLVGTTLAQAGLKRRTAMGTATLAIGANIPDVDVLSYFWGGEAALCFRRGVTHGVLALVVLPFVLTGAMLLWDRVFRRNRGRGTAVAIPRQVLVLSFIAVATHPLLDFLNSYGMRFLAPFSYQWFYGDTLFIVDPWVWGVLAIGMWTARGGERGPRLALVGVLAYVLVMGGSNVAARNLIGRAAMTTGPKVQRLMAAPLAVTPFERWVVVEDAEGYRVGMFNWFSRPKVRLERLPYDVRPSEAYAEALRNELQARRFLAWARFPYYLADPGRSTNHSHGSFMVHVGDARYTLDPKASWAATTIKLAAPNR